MLWFLTPQILPSPYAVPVSPTPPCWYPEDHRPTYAPRFLMHSPRLTISPVRSSLFPLPLPPAFFLFPGAGIPNTTVPQMLPDSYNASAIIKPKTTTTTTAPPSPPNDSGVNTLMVVLMVTIPLGAAAVITMGMLGWSQYKKWSMNAQGPATAGGPGGGGGGLGGGGYETLRGGPFNH
ncbi:unnamed protein product [Closterium sp. NIES-64]|nr:unnamed protein product [Closterium sp. NIES-64]